MRTRMFALALLTLGGCSSTGAVKKAPRAQTAHKTPVARQLPSIAQNRIYQRLQEGETVVGRTDVSGDLTR